MRDTLIAAGVEATHIHVERFATPLESHERARGFVLRCQSHPVSGRVVISYDERR